MTKTSKKRKNDWEKLGLLYGIPKNKKKKCSKLYDDVTNYLLYSVVDLDGELETIIFPVVRKIMNDLPLSEEIDIKDIYNKLTEHFKGYETFKENNPELDAEAEYTVMFCNDYVENIKKQEEIIKLKYYSYGFECPDLSKPLTKEQKDNIYNKLLNQFEKQLKDWIYD